MQAFISVGQFKIIPVPVRYTAHMPGAVVTQTVPDNRRPSALDHFPEKPAGRFVIPLPYQVRVDQKKILRLHGVLFFNYLALQGRTLNDKHHDVTLYTVR
jgi:hypothetical protein